MREKAAFPRVGVVLAPPVDTPPAYFFKIFIPYFIYMAGFFSIQIWLVDNTFFYGVTNSEHTFNIDFTQTLIIMFNNRISGENYIILTK